MNLSRLVTSAACAAALAAPARSSAAPSNIAELPDGTVLVVKRALEVTPNDFHPTFGDGTPMNFPDGKVKLADGKVVAEDDPAGGRDACEIGIKYPKGKKAIPGNKIAAGTRLTVTKVEHHVSKGDGFFVQGYDFVTLTFDHPAAYEMSCHLRDDGPMPMDVFHRTVRGLLEVRLPGAAEDAAAPSGLVGSWRTPCLRVASGRDRKMQLSFAPDGTYVERVVTAVDSACSAPLRIRTETGRWRLAGDGKLDVRTEAVQLTLFSDHEVFEEIQTARAANQDALCGFTDWTSGQAKDVTGLACAGTVMTPRGDWYTSFKLCRETTGACVPPEPGRGNLLVAFPTKSNPGTDPRKRLKELERESWVFFPDR